MGAVGVAQDEVHIWTLSSRQFGPLVLAHSRNLDGDELTQAERIGAPEVRRDFIVSRCLRRAILSLYAPLVAPSAWKFSCNDFGKPKILDALNDKFIQFNVSHTAGLMAVAIASGRHVGIDIERMDRNIDCIQLAESFFSPSEFEFVRSRPDLANIRFTQLWTVKEAVLKGKGRGLHEPLDSVSANIEDGHAACAGEGRTWKLELFEQDQCMGCLAVAVNPNESISVVHKPFFL